MTVTRICVESNDRKHHWQLSRVQEVSGIARRIFLKKIWRCKICNEKRWRKPQKRKVT